MEILAVVVLFITIVVLCSIFELFITILLNLMAELEEIKTFESKRPDKPHPQWMAGKATRLNVEYNKKGNNNKV